MSRATSLFSILNGMRYYGVGTKVKRNIYKFPETYWVVTRVVLSTDQNHGKVYGRLVWRGKAKETEEKITSALKREWQVISTPDYSNFTGTEQSVQQLIPKNAVNV